MVSNRIFIVQQSRVLPQCTFLGLFIPKRKALRLSEPLVTTYQSTRCNNPQDLVVPQRRCEISQPLGCRQVGNLALQELPCTTELGTIRAHRKLRQAVGSTALHYFLSGSLRKCSCFASLCCSHSVLSSTISWICISGWLSA
jgi:hypothetical protein